MRARARMVSIPNGNGLHSSAHVRGARGGRATTEALPLMVATNDVAMEIVVTASALKRALEQGLKRAEKKVS